MAINTSPRKVVPLSTGDEYDTRPKPIPLSTAPPVTKRAFFCGVVVEGPNDGEDLSDGEFRVNWGVRNCAERLRKIFKILLHLLAIG